MTVSTRTWSSQQQDIFSWFETPSTNGHSRHLIVRARAGTGKTTTIVEALKYAPEAAILVCAFNKKIADELTTRLMGTNAVAKTLHAVGFASVIKAWEGIRVEKLRGTRAQALSLAVCGGSIPDAVLRLVTNLHSKGREIAPHARVVGDLTDIAVTFECEPDDVWISQGYDLSYVETKALAAMELAATVKPIATGIDFADMIFLPVRNGWLSKQYDLVVVDEAQDMTTAQLEIAQGVCRGRIAVVGDNCQAIYAFRGADSNSLDRLKTELAATELGLTTTYRCGKAIVALAQQYVPDFQAGDANPEGEVLSLPIGKLTAEATLGDFILSRLNAPLVSLAMSLLRAGKRTRIAGRDIGGGLKAIIRKLRARSVPELITKLRNWEAREVDRAKKAEREDRIEAIQDQTEMLISLTDGVKNVGEVEDRIEALFTDDGLGQAGVITCSSVHRSKGLEANRVFVLADTLRSHNQEELNIIYVSYTRAKQTLVLVRKDADGS